MSSAAGGEVGGGVGTAFSSSSSTGILLRISYEYLLRFISSSKGKKILGYKLWWLSTSYPLSST